MSRLAPNRLTVRRVETAKDGAYCDGGNLWLIVAGAARSWTFRYTSPTTRRRREMGLGPARDLPLARARDMAAAGRRMILEGVDPLDYKRVEQSRLEPQANRTFEATATAFIKEQAPGWRDPRLEAIWTSSLTRLAFPQIGSRPVELIDTADVLAVVRPIWTTKTETADRVRGRIERILDYAATHGWRKGDNPARWRGHLANILPKPSTVAKERHHPALPFCKIAAAMTALARSEGTGALAVRFACLTAARSSEARGALWREIDLEAKVWTVPAERMKASREHRVPLSAAALAVLEAAKERTGGAGLVFPGGKPDRPLSDVALSKALHLAAGTRATTIHGLRSTFRDWVAETTDASRDVAEMALAHTIGDRVEAAYRRGDLFDKRRELMEAWGKWAVPPLPDLFA